MGYVFLDFLDKSSETKWLVSFQIVVATIRVHMPHPKPNHQVLSDKLG